MVMGVIGQKVALINCAQGNCYAVNGINIAPRHDVNTMTHQGDWLPGQSQHRHSRHLWVLSPLLGVPLYMPAWHGTTNIVEQRTSCTIPRIVTSGKELLDVLEEPK